MKFLRCTTLILPSLWLFSAVASAQGELIPLGAPAPTMKTLDQVEARTPLSGSSILITQPGSYYLTETVFNTSGSNGIVIAANNVTLDLNGFSVIGDGSSNTSGVVAAGSVVNIVIKNGFVQAWGLSGIDMNYADSCQIFDVSLFGNGDYGIYGGSNFVIRDCIAAENGNTGIFVGEGSHVEGCIAHSNEDGFDGNPRSIKFINCQARNNTYHGFLCIHDSWVVECLSLDNGEAGIRASGQSNRIQDNHVAGNLEGLRIVGTKNEVSGNLVANNSTNYLIAAGNRLNLLISELPETISWPASVRLAGVVTVPSGEPGLTIAADNVTVDLNGQAIRGYPGSFHGIYAPDPRLGLIVKNGFIQNCGGDGISAMSTKASFVRNVSCISNGNYGMWLGDNAAIEGCVARENGGQGIHAGAASAIRDCIATDNVDAGIVGGQGSIVANCAASGNDGLGVATASGKIEGCAAWDNTSDGIYGSAGTVVTVCSAYDNDGAGVYLGLDCSVVDSRATGNGTDGIRLGARGTATGCGASVNDANGFNVEAAGGSLRDCTAENNAADGFVTVGNIRIRDCHAFGNGGDGIEIAGFSFVTGCQSDGNGTTSSGAGIHATGDRNRIRDNSTVSNDTGIHVTGWYNLIVKNSASGNTTNFNLVTVQNNDWGIIISPGEGFSGSSDYSWANISF